MLFEGGGFSALEPEIWFVEVGVEVEVEVEGVLDSEFGPACRVPRRFGFGSAMAGVQGERGIGGNAGENEYIIQS